MKTKSEKDLEIFSVLSHELRTPLNAIIGISNLLQEKESEPYKEEYYRILKSTSEDLLELVNNILDYSKLNSGVLVVSQRSFDLKQKLGDSLHSQKLAAGSKGLEFLMDFSPDIPDLVMGDQVKVTQIFINLVSNSIKFTSTGKIEVKLSLKEEGAKSLVLECKVEDTGIGIPTASLEKIFHAYHQGEEDINIHYAGTGLGLNITCELVKMLKGSLEVESKEGKGTCFTFLLPFEKTSKAFQLSEKHSDFDISKLKGKKVLLVEDNKINQLVISRYLELWKMNYETANNGEEALEKIKTSEFDVVLMDIHMPKMNGIEAVDKLRSFPGSKYKNLPVIALTAAAEEAGTGEVFSSRFNDFITKPFEADRLCDLLVVYSNLRKEDKLNIKV